MPARTDTLGASPLYWLFKQAMKVNPLVFGPKAILKGQRNRAERRAAAVQKDQDAISVSALNAGTKLNAAEWEETKLIGTGLLLTVGVVGTILYFGTKS